MFFLLLLSEGNFKMLNDDDFTISTAQVLMEKKEDDVVKILQNLKAFQLLNGFRLLFLHLSAAAKRCPWWSAVWGKNIFMYNNFLSLYAFHSSFSFVANHKALKNYYGWRAKEGGSRGREKKNKKLIPSTLINCLIRNSFKYFAIKIYTF